MAVFVAGDGLELRNRAEVETTVELLKRKVHMTRVRLRTGSNIVCARVHPTDRKHDALRSAQRQKPVWQQGAGDGTGIAFNADDRVVAVRVVVRDYG
jgi:hypothetical protein